jgi:general L-amino acid transport system permease protein
VRWMAVGFIEFLRGVPLITVLFMASVMLPLFVPERFAPDKLIRALIGVALFASAYMAEVVRGGLAAIPAGQYQAAAALGLSYWRMTSFVILPQALRVSLPNVVSIFIGLFKDTTLVFVVGIFDFLGTVETARGDPKWAAPNTTVTGYAFAAAFYFVCCYGMSRYARNVERRLARSQAAGTRRL